MENILMRFFRETHHYNPDAIAAHLGISATEYQEIETGEMLLTVKQAGQLGKLFNVKRGYLYDAALQLDLLLSKNEICKIQKEKSAELKQQVHDLQNLLSREPKTDNANPIH